MKQPVTIPYVRIGQIIEFVESMPTSEISFSEFSLSSRLRKSQTRNIIPSLITLGLLEKHKRKIKLTKIGQDLKLSIKTHNKEKSKNIIKSSIQKVAPLSYVVQLLKQEQKLTIEQIGRELAAKYNKSWDHPLTYKTHGASCASIVAFADYGVYDSGVLRESELVSAPLKIPFPNVTFQAMVKLLENIYPYPNISTKDLSQKIGKSQGRLTSELSVCAELKLIRREYRGLYKISEMGEKFISPSLQEEEKSKILKQCLLNSRYKLVIEKLSNVSFNAIKLGEILIYIFRSKSTLKTQKVYGTKFLNWLKYAGIVKKIKVGTYTLDESQIKEVPALKETKEKTVHRVDINEQYKLSQNYYKIGKLIGMFLGSIEKKEITIEEVEKLITECYNFRQTEDVVMLLTEHKSLFQTVKDPRIFSADVKLLEKIIGGNKK